MHRLRIRITRTIYLVAMYSGLRALVNRLLSRTRSRPMAAIIDGQKTRIGDQIQLQIRVHARLPAKPLPQNLNAGMISTSLIAPGIPKCLYRTLLWTSHFGCGHIEIAFYEQHDCVVFYAVRNMVRSNCDRVGLRNWFRNLQMCDPEHEIMVIKSVADALREKGLETKFSDPESCVRLAVQSALVRPERLTATEEALTRKYTRLCKAVRPFMPVADPPKSTP